MTQRPRHKALPHSQDPPSKRRARNTGHVAERTLALPLDRDPWAPPPYDESDIAAFRALREGRAEPHQQTRCLEWLIYACGTGEQPFRPGGADGERATGFACGKQFIGQQILKLINMPMSGQADSEQG